MEIPESGAEGVLVTQGGRFGGYAMLLMDGKPEFDYAFSNQKQFKYRIISNDKLAPGKHTIKFDSQYDGPGFGKSATGTLFVDGQQVAQGKIERTIPLRFSLDETFDVGQDTGTPVVEDCLPARCARRQADPSLGVGRMRNTRKSPCRRWMIGKRNGRKIHNAARSKSCSRWISGRR